MTVVKRFTAAWCQPCKTLTPVFQELQSQYPNVHWVTIDVDANKSATGASNVRSVPTVIVEKNGVEVQRIVGAKSKHEYEMAIR